MKKKYLVIGSPINHSLSPKLHNYWFSKTDVQATYEKKELKLEDLENIISDLKNDKISGLNVTVPFKKNIISFIDELEKLVRTVTPRTFNFLFIFFAIFLTALRHSYPLLTCTVIYDRFLRSFKDLIAAELVEGMSEIL